MRLTECSHLRFATVLLLIICCGISSCKKPKKPSNIYEGNWRLVYFSDREGPHNGGPPPQPSKNIYLANDKIVWNTVVLTSDTANPVIETTKICNLVYSVVTVMDDNSNLNIAEKYVLIDSLNQVVKEYNYNNTVAMKSGQTDYGSGPNNKLVIDSERIRFYDYHWSGNTAYFMERKLEKIK